MSGKSVKELRIEALKKKTKVNKSEFGSSVREKLQDEKPIQLVKSMGVKTK